MMPCYVVSWSWKIHRQKRDRWTKRYRNAPGAEWTLWLFGWLFTYSYNDGKYPPEVEPTYQPWRDALDILYAKILGRAKAKTEKLST